MHTSAPHHSLVATTAFVIALGTAGLTPRLRAQSIGLELGVAGVENYDPQPAFGAALFLPIIGRLQAAFSYTQWPGRDGNSLPGFPRSGFGNRGFKFLAHYRLLGEQGFTASLGAGLGLFELLRPQGDGSASIYEDALLASTIFRVPVSARLAPYGRIDLHVPTDVLRLNWGFILVGLEVALEP